MTFNLFKRACGTFSLLVQESSCTVCWQRRLSCYSCDHGSLTAVFVVLTLNFGKDFDKAFKKYTV